MKKPAKTDAAFTRVSTNDDCAALRPSADANAVNTCIGQSTESKQRGETY
jgi:hypothetical protein